MTQLPLFSTEPEPDPEHERRAARFDWLLDEWSDRDLTAEETKELVALRKLSVRSAQQPWACG